MHRTFLIVITALAWSCGGSDSAGSSTTATPAQTATAGTPATGTTSAATAGKGGSGAASSTPTSSSTATAGKPATSSAAGSGASATTGTTTSTPATTTTASSAGNSAMATTGGTAGMGAVAGSTGSAAGSGGDSGGMASAAGLLPRVTTTDGPGPFMEVVKVKSGPPDGGWLIYPKNIGMNGMKHPIFIFGPGAGTGPDTYDMDGMHWDRYGSYGFIIFCVGSSTMDGSGMKTAFDWTLKQNDDMSSPLYQHMDTAHIAVGGHSLGSIMTFAFLPNDQITTSLHISGGSFDGMGSSHLTKETFFMCGPDGNADLAEPQCEVDYMNAKVPIFYTKLMGATHITSARTGWAATIAWLLWHLADQGDQWKKEFLNDGGQFRTGIYMSESKNW